MSLSLNNTESVATDIVSHLQDPEFWDIKIICSDRAEIAVILVSIRVFVALGEICDFGGYFASIHESINYLHS